MRIDADSGGSVDWNEFMNYMLIENTTLSSMKAELFEYQTYIHNTTQEPQYKTTVGNLENTYSLEMQGGYLSRDFYGNQT